MARQDADAGMRCIKYMLFTTNFMFALIGFLLISVGSTITSIYSNFQLFMEEHFFSPAALLVAIGVIIFFVAMFGCFGAIRKSTVMINMYGFLLLIILILEISATIAAYAMRGDIQEYVDNRMQNSMQDYQTEEYTKFSWDQLQESIECCGKNGPNDWYNYMETLPDSCMDIRGSRPYGPYNRGCLRQLSFIISECAGLVATGGLCVAIVQLLGVVFALMLAKSIRRLKTEIEMQRQEQQRFYAEMAKGQSEKTPVGPVLYTPEETNA